MKLIRLTTRNTDGTFECNFKTDINIKENSKVALKSASFSTKLDLFIIDSSNDNLRWDWTGSNDATTFVVNVSLNHGSYNEDNIQDFLDDIQLKLNNGLDISGTNYDKKMVGLQWKVHTHKGVLDIGYLYSPYSFNATQATLTNIDKSAVNDTLTKTTAQSINDTARVFWNKPLIKGAGVYQISIATMTNTATADTGFFFGITRTALNLLDPTDITTLHKDTYIYVDGLEGGGGGFPISFGNLDANGANPQLTPTAFTHTGLADTLEIRRENGKITMGIHRTGGGFTYQELFSMNVDSTTNFYPYIIMRSDNTKLSLAQGRTQLDPYLVRSNTERDSINTLGAVPIASPTQEGTNVITIDNTLEEILGFELLDLVSIGENGNFKATNLFNFTLFNDTYLIILDNLRLESYDSLDGIERSILGTINVSDNNPNRIVQYESNTLDYIEIKNKKEMSLRNIKGRILTSDLGSVLLNGLTSIVILID